MTIPTPTRRWYHVTPTRFFVGLLAVQVFLFLSERFHWFPFNDHKSWAVLIAVGVVGLAVLVMLVWGLACVLLRRRFQFGVRSLLLFLVAVSVPLGWFAWEMQKAKRQREAVEAVVGLGGSVAYEYQREGRIGWPNTQAESATPAWLRKPLGDDFFCNAEEVGYGGNDIKSLVVHLRELPHLESLQFPFGQITGDRLEHLAALTNIEALNLRRTRVTDEGLNHLAALTNLRWLALGHTQITSDGLRHLAGLTNLESLSVNDTAITDAGVAHLRMLTNLNFLELSSTEITDNGLEHLKGFTKFQYLCIGGTRVTDEGVRHLTGLANLESLDLGYTDVSDEGLVHLRRLPNLRHLNLVGTQVTDEGVSKLQQAMPNCDIKTQPLAVFPSSPSKS
jgi:Leucine-rich repeat (LRR) protein